MLWWHVSVCGFSCHWLVPVGSSTNWYSSLYAIRTLLLFAFALTPQSTYFSAELLDVKVTIRPPPIITTVTWWYINAIYFSLDPCQLLLGH